MATWFVNSGAAGANTGLSWTDAWVSAASSNGVAAGDIVKVHKAHSETALTTSINWSNGTKTTPVYIICVDKDNSDALSTGAVIGWNTTAVGPTGNIYTYGITWTSSAASFQFSCGSDGLQTHESGTLSGTGGTTISVTAGTRPSFLLINENVDLSAATSAASTMGVASGALEWHGGTYTCRATQTNLFASAMPMLCEGVLFSGTVTNLSGATNATFGASYTRFRKCVAPTYTNVFSSGGNSPADYSSWLDLSGLHAAGTITTASLAPAIWYEAGGSVAADLAHYRSGGASDNSQANPYSWAMVSNSSAGIFAFPLEGLPITRWINSGSQTLTIYVASGVTLNNDDFWIEVLSPSEAVSATALGKFQTSRRGPLAANAPLTTDGISTWNGTGVGTKQKISLTIAPTIPGWVHVRPMLGKSTVTVYVDPVIDVDGDVNGYSRMIGGVQHFSAAAPAGPGVFFFAVKPA